MKSDSGKGRSDSSDPQITQISLHNLWIALFVVLLALALSCSSSKTKVNSPLPPPAGFVADYARIDLEPTDQSWGNREMYVRDPDGNSIRFVLCGS